MSSERASAFGREPLRWEDFIALDEDDRRELIDGALVEVDVPTRLHEWVVALLTTYLMNWVLARNAGVVLSSGYKVRVSERRGVMPDLQFFRRGGRPVPEGGLEEGAPDLAVEVISPTSARYDRVEKLNWYAAIGVAEYWIVDPENRTLERLLLEPSKQYRVSEAVAGEAIFRPASFEGLEIPLARLWNVPEI